MQQLTDITPPPIKGPACFGLIALVVFFGGFLLWTSLAKLETAAIAAGKVSVDTNRKTVQHLEGGIVKKLLVKEGSVVKEGQTLLELDKTQAQARYNLYHGQLITLVATEARLKAERDNAKQVNFPAWLIQEQQYDPEISKILRSQVDLFNTRLQSYNYSIQMLNKQIEQLNSEIQSLESQMSSSDKQIALVNEELKAVAYLEKKKYIDKPHLLALQREISKLTGDRGELSARVAQAQQKIAETQTKILDAKDKRLNNTLEELRQTQKQLIEVQQNEKAAADTLARTAIVAPRSGTVVNLNAHTVGGVISPGATILDIIPAEDKMIVEAKLNPLDIDIVRDGLKARVRFNALKIRTTPTLEGKVDTVSADSIIDKTTGQAYYLARISIDPKEIKKIKNLKLYPGMPVEVMIVVDNRSPFEYFFLPIKESFNRAFHEQ